MVLQLPFLQFCEIGSVLNCQYAATTINCCRQNKNLYANIFASHWQSINNSVRIYNFDCSLADNTNLNHEHLFLSKKLCIENLKNYISATFINRSKFKIGGNIFRIYVRAN